ncbi:DUF397 domain-containing protein [Spirillospora sp. NPDC047279]|uniref:DUF397 domain-containing protein n=1 Tax=Spirillospora sp. NPDC047279 TaxID=3155478 RepID=UPI0033F8BA01
MTVQWRKSSRSQHGGEGECVELSINVDEVTLIRDSKKPAGARLALTAGELAGFLNDVKAGRYDL